MKLWYSLTYVWLCNLDVQTSFIGKDWVYMSYFILGYYPKRHIICSLIKHMKYDIIKPVFCLICIYV